MRGRHVGGKELDNHTVKLIEPCTLEGGGGGGGPLPVILIPLIYSSRFNQTI